MKSVTEQCQAAKAASVSWQGLTTAQKNDGLHAMRQALIDYSSEILLANQKDVEAGSKNGLSDALIDRLKLTEERIQDIADGLATIAQLADPINDVVSGWQIPNGIQIRQIRVPLGVVGMIYEARPNVTVDAVGLCLKSGNAVVLRGSSSAYQSNHALVSIMKSALESVNIDSNAVQLLEDTSRESVDVFVQQSDSLDLVIPRGGAGLIQRVVRSAYVPTIETGVGNCHIFVDKSANIDNALRIVKNAKVQRPSVCNSCETVLVHADIAESFLPMLRQTLGPEVTLRGCENTRKILTDIDAAEEADWGEEYLDLILAVRVVSDLDNAISHIRQYGTQHTEAILTESLDAARRFTEAVDAAAVLVNTSTRFTDGGEFGFGAEIGISTQKLHVRGPMGLQALTTTKYILEGTGQIR